ncbi:MAG TPA: ferritin-like domain-containing protein [Candidatus Obscuribacterales bacterium]
MQGDFVTDMNEIRRRAREHVEAGPVTSAYKADKDKVVKLLNDVLATELVCVLRYRQHYHVASSMFAETVAAEFKQHADEEQQHAEMVAERIEQLGGIPDYNPQGLLTRSASEYKAGKDSLIDMIREDLVAERIAVETYTEMIRFIGEKDPTTRRVLEAILAQEEEHADDLASMLTHIDNITKGRGS